MSKFVKGDFVTQKRVGVVVDTSLRSDTSYYVRFANGIDVVDEVELTAVSTAGSEVKEKEEEK